MTVPKPLAHTIGGRSTKKILATVNALMALFVAFGLAWTGEQVALFVAAVQSIVFLIADED